MSNVVPEGWSISTLSDLAFIDQKSLKGSTEPDYRFKYIDIASVKTARIDVPSNYMTFEGSPSRARKIVQKGDVLMSTVRPNLQSFAYFDKEGDDFIASTGFAVITAKKTSDGRFLYQSILSDDVSRQIDSLVAGSSYPAISSANVKCLEVLAPPLPEQQKIATILSSVDDVIEKTRAQIDKLKDLKTGMMQELLTKGIGHTEFKDSPVGLIPVGWECKTIDEISIRIWIGLVTTMTKHYVDEGIPLIRNSDIKEFYFKYEGMINLATEFSASNQGRSLQFGDIATVHTGDVGTSAVVCERLHGAQGFATINTRVNPLLISAEFLCEMLNSSILGAEIKKVVTGDGRDNLNLKDFVGLTVPVPTSLIEQRKIHETINSTRIKKRALTEKLRVAISIKKALMQDLLTGKVRVKLTDKESAVV